MLPPLRRQALVLAALVPLLAVCAAGCSGGARDAAGSRSGAPGATGTAQDAKPPTPKPAGSPGDILVAGRPVTGWQASGNPKAPFRRIYTDGELYAPVTGYRSLAFGAAGGLDAVLAEDIDAGRDVATTIDPAVQRAAFDALRGRQGAAVALDAETGAVLGMVSAPSFDPGSFSGYAQADEKAWKALQAQGFDGPLKNRALRDAENPGAAVHVLVAAAALENGLLPSVDAPTRGAAVYLAPNSTTEFSGDPAHCADASLRVALRYSCANVFARIASELGAGALASTATAFGFGDDTMDTPVRAFASTWPREPGNPTQLALMANGLSEVKATPVQLAVVTAVLANGGNRVHPRTVAGPRTPVPAERAVSRRTADQLQSALGARTGAWVPSASVSWALSSTRSPSGRPLAVVVCLSSPTDSTAQAGPIAERIAGADKR
ncbi:penicillin-binding transpeptidase domain-containing protein [Streptomyces sp. NBC_00435]|uniref:penicillin-binding transpeptidase domain-containing protein n=1 Tax=Streptomyces sp. NBC_00435 TaxID=2903649 RepID=UPI002E21C7A5